MPTIRRIALRWDTVFAISTTGVFLPASAWMDAGSVDKVRGVIESRGLQGDLQVQLCWQLADHEDAPGGTTVFGAVVTTNAVTYPTSGYTDVGTTAEDAQLIRFGWWVKNASTSTLNLARVAAALQLVMR